MQYKIIESINNISKGKPPLQILFKLQMAIYTKSMYGIFQENFSHLTLQPGIKRAKALLFAKHPKLCYTRLVRLIIRRLL